MHLYYAAYVIINHLILLKNTKSLKYLSGFGNNITDLTQTIQYRVNRA